MNTQTDKTIIDWDAIYKDADNFLLTHDPIGKIIGYNHKMLIEHLKEKYPTTDKLITKNNELKS